MSRKECDTFSAWMVRNQPTLTGSGSVLQNRREIDAPSRITLSYLYNNCHPRRTCSAYGSPYIGGYYSPAGGSVANLDAIGAPRSSHVTSRTRSLGNASSSNWLHKNVTGDLLSGRRSAANHRRPSGPLIMLVMQHRKPCITNPKPLALQLARHIGNKPRIQCYHGRLYHPKSSRKAFRHASFSTSPPGLNSTRKAAV